VVQSFSTAFTRGLPHGLLAAVHLPPTTDSITDKVLHKLHKDERAHAEDLNGHRQIEWIGGRLAARVAVRALGANMGALMTDAWGAPSAPKSLTISIAHKKNLALAIVAQRNHGQVGLDFEILGQERLGIAKKVLTLDEQAMVDALPEHRQWTSVLLHFTIKEAIYKALAPRLRRYIGFQEAQIGIGRAGSASVVLTLDPAAEPVSVEARYAWMPEGVVATARARWNPTDETVFAN